MRVLVISTTVHSISPNVKRLVPIEAMAAAGNLDMDAVRDELERLVGTGDDRIARLDEALRRARPD